MLSIFSFWSLVMHLETFLYNDFIHCCMIRYISLKYSKMETTQENHRNGNRNMWNSAWSKCSRFFVVFFLVWLDVQLMETVDKTTLCYNNNNYNMPWMGCVCALLPCLTAAQESSKGRVNCGSLSALHQEWEEGSGLLVVGSPTALARAMFLPCSQAELNTQRKEQLLFNLFLAKCPMNPKKKALNGKLLISRALMSSPALCLTGKKISRQKTLGSLFQFWTVPET